MLSDKLTVCRLLDKLYGLYHLNSTLVPNLYLMLKRQVCNIFLSKIIISIIKRFSFNS